MCILIASKVFPSGNSNTVENSNVNNKTVSEQTTVNPEEATVSTTKVPEIDKNIKIIADSTTLKTEEAEAVFKTLKSVGFTEVDDFKSANGTGVDDTQSYNATCDGVTTIVTIEKRKTFYIGSGDIDLYADGKVVNNINDYLVPEAKRISFLISSEDYVKQCLKAPSTAKFPSQIFSADEWSVGRKKDLVQVKSYVDSQNSFGAMIRSKFVVQIDYDTETLICVIVDGKVVYGSAHK